MKKKLSPRCVEQKNVFCFVHICVFCEHKGVSIKQAAEEFI